MPAADFTPYYQPSGTGADGTKFDNALAYLQSIINGIDQNNFAAGKILDLTKLMQGGASAKQLLLWDGTNWAPAGGYTAYTPTWTATGTGPAIGNAVVIGQYLQIGKLVHCYGSITFGTTSTYGTGNYRIALPVNASANAASSSFLGTGFGYDSSAGAEALYRLSAITANTFQLSFGSTYLGASSPVGQTTPWTWAQGDIIGWNLTYEAA